MLLMGKSTISMAIFHSYVKLPEGTNYLPLNICEQKDAVQNGKPASPDP